MAGRQRRFGVRARVVASFLVLLAIAELASIVVLHQVGDRRIDDQVTRNLGSSADDLRARLTSVEGTLGEPGGPTFADVVTEHLGTQPARADEAQLAFVDGQPFAVSSGAPVPLADLAIASTWSTLPRTTTGSLDTDAGEMRWLAVPVRSGDRLLGVYVTTAFVADQVDALRSTIVTVSLVTVLVLIGACLLAWGAAGGALSPLRDLASTARSVSSGDDLDAHIEVASTDEVGDLASSFNEMLDNLRVAFDSQKRFLDGAAHELRAPITIVRGHLELLDDDPDERAKDIDLVLDEVDRMARLVEELRVLARSERPDFLTLEDVDVGTLVTDIGRKAEALAPREWVVEPGAECVIRADGQRLTQAVLNLVDNAVSVTSEGTRIEIGTSAGDGTIALWVRDHGPGIDPGDLPSLFDREGRTIARRPGGTGLGLPIVAAIARAHGGTAVAESTPGDGARIEIRIPRGSR